MNKRKTPEAAVQPERVRLHPEADAILVVHDDSIRKEFLVSSAVLSVASDYFRTLLRSGFKEGLETRRGDCPTILMNEDDPQAMETILSVLHYRNLSAYDRLDPTALAAVALQSDKYDCTRALRPWVSHWFRNISGNANTDELGSLLMAAYFLRSSENFADISARVVRQARVDLESIWANHNMITLLPQKIKDALTGRVSQTLHQLHRELQDVERRLRSREGGYAMSGRLCMRCGRYLPSEAKKCNPCYNTTLVVEVHVEYCTKHTRIAEYFSVLSRSELWPSLGPFQECTISELANRFVRAKDDRQHRCSAGAGCPLLRALEELSERVNRIVEDIEEVLLDFDDTSPAVTS